MSQVSVVHYSTPPQKINNVLQQNTNSNNNKTGERQIIVLRKPSTILPQPKDYKKNDILITNPGKKGGPKKTTASKDLKTNPPPIAVARRNARERNRVKQVNNGFANLRQHIPNFIAQAFENTNGRGNKKLSKVETLRMAVEYIRSLEEVLAMDGEPMPHLMQDNISSRSCLSPTSVDSNSQSDLAYPFAMSPSEEDDDLSSVATPPPPTQQFIRINTSNNTYEIISSNVYENSENLDPMSVDQHHLLTDPTLIDSNLDFAQEDISYLQVNPLQSTTGSLSPGMYSEGSLSPNNESAKLSETVQQNCFIPVFASAKLGENFNVQIKTEINELPVISLKSENDIAESHGELADVISWWEQNQTQQTNS
ncbi:uncharacterized protein LOC115878311 [Sitophilus oryzae]|uniref:Uncharacterized protein LOC115878311 n=1 Tax=Sitophilus oryzae TaxID=7048 RepID=A0A6J2XI74_SITOR|nr:uncharacterized protein LOC115878311 [Sitophilus oryzae]